MNETIQGILDSGRMTYLEGSIMNWMEARQVVDVIDDLGKWSLDLPDEAVDRESLGAAKFVYDLIDMGIRGREAERRLDGFVVGEVNANAAWKMIFNSLQIEGESIDEVLKGAGRAMAVLCGEEIQDKGWGDFDPDADPVKARMLIEAGFNMARSRKWAKNKLAGRT